MRAPQPLHIAAFVSLLALPHSAAAGPIYDFSTLAPSNIVTDLGSSTTLGTVTASAYYNNGGTWTGTTLIGRNEGADDAGLGVCSPGESCNIGGSGGGDANELSQLTNNEAILLTLASGSSWVDLWVSSLDSGGTGGLEQGTLYWGNTSNITTLLGG